AQAYRLLVRMITQLEAAPGSLLVEKELMAKLGIGRTPIREALQRLSSEGLVVHQPNRGMFVAEIGANSVQHIYEFRAIIDRHLVRLAAERARAPQRQAFDALPPAFEQAIATDDMDRYVELDRRFYAVLAEAAENVYLAEVIPRIFNLHLRLFFYISARGRGWQDVASAHTAMTREVADAVRRRDPDAAERAVTAYIASRHQDMRDLL
ncbi:MAG: GntR family transcriptional regulator, partial [Miltoncostaeaceae bacterium]